MPKMEFLRKQEFNELKTDIKFMEILNIYIIYV